MTKKEINKLHNIFANVNCCNNNGYDIFQLQQAFDRQCKNKYDINDEYYSIIEEEKRTGCYLMTLVFNKNLNLKIEQEENGYINILCFVLSSGDCSIGI